MREGAELVLVARVELEELPVDVLEGAVEGGCAAVGAERDFPYDVLDAVAW